MKVHAHIVRGRREQLATWLQQHSYAALQEVCKQFKISEATARRDLRVLEKEKKIVRTYGGALAEFNRRFASFHNRLSSHAAAKRQIAQATLQFIRPEQTCFFDAGTTIYALAQALQQSPITPLTIVTHSLPVAEILATVSGIDVHLLGGQFLPKQSMLFGKATRKSLSFYEIDQAFLCAEGFDDQGLWNSQKDVVAFQQAVIARAKLTFSCLDESKFNHSEPIFLAPWKNIDKFVTNADSTTLRKLSSIPKQKVIST